MPLVCPYAGHNHVALTLRSFVYAVYAVYATPLRPKLLSRHMGKLTICIGENKGADQLRSNCEADQRIRFRYMNSKIPPLINSKISSFSFLCLYKSVCVRPVWKPHCWFSHEAAQLVLRFWGHCFVSSFCSIWTSHSFPKLV